ncbi:MAG: transglycosylase domain-containing protein, partial [Culicoidibacterales bacterium]
MNQTQQPSRRKQTKKTKTKKQRNFKFFNWRVFVGILGGLFLAAVFTGFAILNYFIDTRPTIDIDSLKEVQSSIMYDLNGEIVANFKGTYYEPIEYSQLADVYIDAVIATEDSNFFVHEGIDIKRIAASLVSNLIANDIVGGGSTITQQLLKSTTLTAEQTYERKIYEMILALELEQIMTKEEIFEAYVNTINFGPVYGVGSAARYYFNKDVSELTLPEAAMLAGIPQLPSYHNPYLDIQTATERYQTVLNLMVRHNYLSETEANTAKQIPLADLLEESEFSNSSAYFTYMSAVTTEVLEKTDLDPTTQQLNIYTNLNTQMQDYANDLLDSGMISFPDDQYQAAFVFSDTTTGQVYAIGGGRGQNEAFGFNFATEGGRQPGSTIKPLLDYAPGIERFQWSSHQLFTDEKYQYSDGVPFYNYDFQYKGDMSMNAAIADSRNVPAVKAFQEVGPTYADQFIKKLGIDFGEPLHEAYALGGGKEVTPLQLAGAYAAFGNGGRFNEPYFVTKITDNAGNILYEHTPENEQVMQPETATIMNNMLRYSATSGLAQRGNISGMTIAAKTGTTTYAQETIDALGLPSTADKDHWFVGYTPEYTMAVWGGYDTVSSEYYNKFANAPIVSSIFSSMMSEFGKYGTAFPTSSNVVSKTVLKNVWPTVIAPANTPASETEVAWFVKGTEPTQTGTKIEVTLAAPNAKVTVSGNNLVMNWSAIEPSFSTTDSAQLASYRESVGNTIYIVYGITSAGEQVELYRGSNLSYTATTAALAKYSKFGFVTALEKNDTVSSMAQLTNPQATPESCPTGQKLEGNT